MLLDKTHHENNQNTTSVLTENTHSICLLQIETQDSLHDVFDVLCTQMKPVLLLLPPAGTLFSQAEHFHSLKRCLSERTHPPFLGMVLSPQHTKEIGLADHSGISHVPSVEEGRRSYATYTIFSHEDSPSVPPDTVVMAPQITNVGQEETPRILNTRWLLPSFKRRSFLLGGGVIALLLGVSTLLFPLLLFTPTHSQSGTTAPTSAGTVSFTSSGLFDPDLSEGSNDIITVSLRSIPTPPAGMSYDTWLMPDPGDDTTMPLLLGILHAGSVTFTYTSPSHTNLLASYSGLRVTVQPTGSAPETPSQDPTSWRWEGFIANTPTPGDEQHYSLLSHMRHLLAKDPTLQANGLSGGLVLWLAQNVSKVEEWASAAQGQWHGAQTSSGDADLIHRLLLRMLDYLDGQSFVWHDVPAHSPWLVDPLAGKIGLLNRVQNQEPPGFLAHVDIHLTGLAQAPGHTAQQKQLAILIDGVLSRMTTDVQQVRQDAVSLVSMNTQQLQQPGNQVLLDTMAKLTTEVKSGWLDQQTGEDIGGVVWITSRLQQFAVIPLSSISPGQGD